MMCIKYFGLALLCMCFIRVQSLDNGLALTPPMGWMSWERFRCNLDCDNDPENCISERLIKEIADKMVSDGYLAVGYEYVVIDDCWLASERDANGKLQPDPKRFPSGLKSLADYLHSKGLKFGLYEDYGTKTCKGYPGSQYYLQMDMQTFADWGVDYLKLDGCYSDPHEYGTDYPPVQFFLNITGRPIVYSSAFALHQLVKGVKPDYKKLAEISNLGRNGPDIYDSWDSVMEIVTFFGKNEGNFAEVAGPGYFNDPDELIVGDFALSYSQQLSHFAMWCVLGGPMMMSVDLRTIAPESRELLQNKHALAINQDALGVQGQLVKAVVPNVQLWTKPVLPKGSVAFTVLNAGNKNDGMPIDLTLHFTDIVKNSTSAYKLVEVYDNKPMGLVKASDTLKLRLAPMGVFFGKLTPTT